MADPSGDKKHPATEQRRRKARSEGQVVKSQDLSSAAMLLCGLGALWWYGGTAMEYVAGEITESLSSPRVGPLDSATAVNRLLRMVGRLAVAIVPIMGVLFAGAIVVNLSQTGLMLTTAKLMPKLSHIDPISGVKRILSIQGVMRLLFGLFKVSVITAVAYFALHHYHEPILSLAALSVRQIATVLFDSIVGTCLWIGVALFVLAIAEYAFQKWKHEQDLMMTDQEIRDEMKESEGDPQIAARRRQVQRQMVMQRAQSDVPRADVVVTNPTELAIAIRYDATSMPAPVVLAKGAGVLAQRIRRMALQHGVPVVERKPLAQFLYKNVEVGDTIPPDQYQAVAEVLRYVYQLQGKEIPKANAA